MQPLTEQREYDDEQDYSAPMPPARLGGTDIFRGAMVILTAVLIGAFVISRGLGDPTGTGVDATEELDPASASADETLAGQDDATGDAALAGTDTATDGTGTGDTTLGATDQAGTGTTVDPLTGATSTVPADTSTTTTPLATVRPPSEVRVLVLNGAGSQGIAAKGTEMLQAASYVTAAPKNADALGSSAIYYADGYGAEALEVAAVFGSGLDTLVEPLDATNQPVDDLQDAAIIVVLGTDGAIPLT